MKTLIKLFLTLTMPNFGIAWYIRNTIRNSENEDKILTRKKIERLYYWSVVIVLVPFLIFAQGVFFSEKKMTEPFMYLSRNFLIGLIISLLFIFTSKSLKVTGVGNE